MSAEPFTHATDADDLVALGERLVHEFAGVVPAGYVLQCLSRCRDRLVDSGLRCGLVPATEAAVRVSLAAAGMVRATG